MQQKMWRCAVGVSLLSLIVYASIVHGESKIGNAGITGVVLVGPIRPGPIKRGSESPTAAPLPNARSPLAATVAQSQNLRQMQ